MRIESLTIKNYRSIERLKIDNLNPVNLFFGKNNVGKSNILTGLNLAFYCLKNDNIFLPDTMFYNRNIYKPIEIILDLILEDDFYDAEEIGSSLVEKLEESTLRLELSLDERINVDFSKGIKDFLDFSHTFKPLKKLCLKIILDYDEKVSDIKILIEDKESNYSFDYKKYKIIFKKINNVINDIIRKDHEIIVESIWHELSKFDPDISLYAPRISSVDYPFLLKRLENDILKIKDKENRNNALFKFEQLKETLISPIKEKLFESISNIFNTVKQYFDKISYNFILIPNKGYLQKGPFDEKGGEQIKIFDIEKFKDRLASLIESPNKKERILIQQFNSIFSKSYKDLGEIEIRKFREEVFAIFDSGYTALPIESQGQGIQDLFIYLAHMILFDSAIIAIEEPEGGLSTENQKILHKNIEDIYSGSDKQIFISSHSEEFETPNSYIIEMDKEGTKEISRTKNKEEYEEKIDKVLIKRNLEAEKESYGILLKEVAEKQQALDILNYIEKLDDKEKLDAGKISKELGYKKDKVEEILNKMTMRMA